MELVQIQPDNIVLGQPLPFSLLTEDGTLLAKKGGIIHTRPELDLLHQKRSIYVEKSLIDSRLTEANLNALINQDTPLRDIALAQANPKLSPKPVPVAQDDRIDWQSMQLRLNRLLRDASNPHAMAQLDLLHTQLSKQVLRNPDASLLVLFHLSVNDTTLYSTTHALLVSTLCLLTAHEVLDWDSEDRQILGKAALTMNFAMTEMQDQLARQVQRPSRQQKEIIAHHPALSVQLLQQLGVTDSRWLDAVSQHHSVGPGPLKQLSIALQMARLIQRADIFAALLSPRAARIGMKTPAALQSAYFDERHQVDETGMALIKAVGIYPPGSFVQLVNGEVAMVIKRGRVSTAPKVAVLVNKAGLATSEPITRHTELTDYRVRANVPHGDVKAQIDLSRLLALI